MAANPGMSVEQARWTASLENNPAGNHIVRHWQPVQDFIVKRWNSEEPLTVRQVAALASVSWHYPVLRDQFFDQIRQGRTMEQVITATGEGAIHTHAGGYGYINNATSGGERMAGLVIRRVRELSLYYNVDPATLVQYVPDEFRATAERIFGTL